MTIADQWAESSPSLDYRPRPLREMITLMCEVATRVEKSPAGFEFFTFSDGSVLDIEKCWRLYACTKTSL